MAMWFIIFFIESLWKNLYVILVRFLNVVFASLSSENVSLFKPLIECGGLFSVADPKCNGKKCGVCFYSTALLSCGIYGKFYKGT